MPATTQEERVEASKAAGKIANERQLRHTASRGRKDAAWAQVAAGSESQAQAPQVGRNTSGDDLRRELRADLDAQQLRTFTRWWNAWLGEVNLKVDDLCEDVKAGVYPIKLLEVLSDSSCGKYNPKAKMKFHCLENHNVFLASLKAKSIKLVNIGAEDLYEGNQKLVLGLTWTLILRYEIHQFGGNESELLQWTKDLANDYGIDVEGGWTQGFSDGHAFCAIGARPVQHPVQRPVRPPPAHPAPLAARACPATPLALARSERMRSTRVLRAPSARG